MRMILSYFVATLFIAVSCTKIADTDPVIIGDDMRALFVNEGQFQYGTGSLTALYGDNTYQNDLFSGVNKRPLGDVPQSIKRVGDNYYIPVNNSNKIEVIDAVTFQSVETMVLTHSTIPMYVEHLGADSIIVSDQSSQSAALMIMDINHDEERDVLRRLIPMDCETFQMRLLDDKLFVVGSTHLSIFDMSNLTAEGRRDIDLTLSNFTNICLDANGNIWMLAASGVVCVDPISEEVIASVEMEGVNTLWGNLDIDSDGRWLYFNIDNLIYSIDTFDPKVPTEPIITHENGDSEWTTFSLGVSKEGTIFVVRSSFYSTTRGRVFEYNLDGTIASLYIVDGVEQPYFSAGIFPRCIYFL